MVGWRAIRARLTGFRWPSHRPRRFPSAVLTAAWLAAALALWGGPVPAAEPPAAAAAGTPAAAGLPTPPAAIPIEHIAPSATEVAHLLGAYAEHSLPSHEIDLIHEALAAASTDLAAILERTETLLREHPSLDALQTLDQVLRVRQLQLTAWLDLATARVARLQEALDRLATLQQSWTRTRDMGQMATAPAPILQQVQATLGSIEAALPKIQAQRDQALGLQARIAQDVVRLETPRAEIARIQQGAVGGVLARDSRPLWSPSLWAQAQTVLPARWSQVVDAHVTDLHQYLTDPSKRMPLHLGLFILALGVLLAARGQVDAWAAAGRDIARIRPVVNRPIAAAALIALMAATAVTAPTPETVKQLFLALALAPIIRLARPVVSPRWVPVLYTTGALFALDTLRHAFGGIPPFLGQVLVFLESVAGAALLAWWLARERRLGPGATADAPLLRRVLPGLLFLGFALGALASLLGYLRLAQLTTPAILAGAADALWLYATVEVATAVAAYVLRVWPLRCLYMTQHHLARIEARAHQLFVWLAVLGWWMRYLSYLGLLEPTLAKANALLGTRFAFGTFSTSAGDILAFVATLVVAYLLSALIRFVLQEEVYPRVGVAKGLSYAASSVVHYGILAIAFFVALSLLGVTLTQVTVLAGALGVGIGFGLQSVVNNFVSGLILLFERPVNVGDAIQVGELQGWVRRIGIRASVVRTSQGAEVIIPNAQLITGQVTNWTLSDQQRRLDLPLGLNYGAAPAEVIALLEGVARAHPKVLADPSPRCLFMGYGDSSINFQLRAWTDYSSTTQVQSDLTTAIYDAVYAAGLSFPFPQREVRLLQGGAEGPAGSGSHPAERSA
jgi:potassium efflux system protein